MIQIKNIKEIIDNIQCKLEREENDLIIHFEKIKKDTIYRKEKIYFIKKLIYITSELFNQNIIHN